MSHGRPAKFNREGRGTHKCPAPGCTTRVPDRVLACRDHWWALPKDARTAILGHYRPGQDATTLTDGYREALAECIRVWEDTI